MLSTFSRSVPSKVYEAWKGRGDHFAENIFPGEGKNIVLDFVI